MIQRCEETLTTNVYTDPKLLDVAGAVASLPELLPGMLAANLSLADSCMNGV